MTKNSGVYCLEILVTKHIALNVGALGEIEFSPGTYIYCGSAQKNLSHRIDRHRAAQKKIRWHIDYLTSSQYAAVVNTYIKNAPRANECITAEILADNGIAVNGFGSSDCNCISHLFRVTSAKLLLESGYTELHR